MCWLWGDLLTTWWKQHWGNPPAHTAACPWLRGCAGVGWRLCGRHGAVGILRDAVPAGTAPVLKVGWSFFGSSYSCDQPGSHFSKYISGYCVAQDLGPVMASYHCCSGIHPQAQAGGCSLCSGSLQASEPLYIFSSEGSDWAESECSSVPRLPRPLGACM